MSDFDFTNADFFESLGYYTGGILNVDAVDDGDDSKTDSPFHEASMEA